MLTKALAGVLGFDQQGADDAEEHLSADYGLGADNQLMTRRNVYRRVATTNPGQLTVRAIGEWRQLMEAADLEVTGDDLSPVALRYFMQVWSSHYRPDEVSEQDRRELRTYMEAIDAILRGNSTCAADLLVQQARAKMMSIRDGHWGAARWLQLLPVSSTMMEASAEDEDFARQQELSHCRRLERVAKVARTGESR